MLHTDGEGRQEGCHDGDDVCGWEMEGASHGKQADAVACKMPDVGMGDWVEEMGSDAIATYWTGIGEAVPR